MRGNFRIKGSFDIGLGKAKSRAIITIEKKKKTSFFLSELKAKRAKRKDQTGKQGKTKPDKKKKNKQY